MNGLAQGFNSRTRPTRAYALGVRAAAADARRVPCEAVPLSMSRPRPGRRRAARSPSSALQLGGVGDRRPAVVAGCDVHDRGRSPVSALTPAGAAGGPAEVTAAFAGVGTGTDRADGGDLARGWSVVDRVDAAALAPDSFSVANSRRARRPCSVPVGRRASCRVSGLGAGRVIARRRLDVADEAGPHPARGGRGGGSAWRRPGATVNEQVTCASASATALPASAGFLNTTLSQWKVPPGHADMLFVSAYRPSSPVELAAPVGIEPHADGRNANVWSPNSHVPRGHGGGGRPGRFATRRFTPRRPVASSPPGR